MREARRELSALSMIRTAKGPAAGSFGTAPTAEHISDFLSANMALFSHTAEVSLDDFLEARRAREVPAARLAARRRTDTDLARLRLTTP